VKAETQDKPQFSIFESVDKEKYGEKKEDIDVYITPCGQSIPKIEIEWIDQKPRPIRTLTSENIVKEHCEKCIECKIISGFSKAMVLTQDQVAHLFGFGIDNKRSGSNNFSSCDGVLTHYRTIEAIRTTDGKIIENRECWSGGFAHCSSPKHIDAWLDLTTLNSEFVLNEQELRHIEILNTDQTETNRWNISILLRIGTRYFINGFDGHARYISELSEPCETLEQAYESLRPNVIKRALWQGFELPTPQECETCANYVNLAKNTPESKECKLDGNGYRNGCGYIPLIEQDNTLTIKRQGELFFIPVNQTLEPFRPKSEQIQKRKKTQVVLVYGKCKECGIETRKERFEVEHGTQKLSDLRTTIERYIEYLKDPSNIVLEKGFSFLSIDEKDRPFALEQLNKALTEIANNQPISEVLIVNRIQDPKRYHPTVFNHSWQIDRDPKLRKREKCSGKYTDKTMQRIERLGIQYDSFPQIPKFDHHTTTELVQISNVTYVRGVVRHSNHEHRSLSLGQQWHVVAPNTQKQGVSIVRGRFAGRD
jgi:predicted Zn-ribbon and HTH transcriptional regulator